MRSKSTTLMLFFFAASIAIGLPLVMITGEYWLFGVVALAVAFALHLWAKSTGRLNG